MKIYSRYIFYKTLLSFGALVTILVSLIWFSRAISFVHYITDNGVDVHQFLYLFVLILPWLMLFIIPISLFVAILMVYNRLITNNEITILRNSGLTKMAIARPLFIIAFLTSLLCFVLSFYLMPHANKELRLSRTNFQNNYSSLAINPQTFSTLKNLTIYAKNRDKENHLFGILLHDERSESYSITITARDGNIITEDNSVLLYMKNGTIQKFNYDSRKSEILDFDSYVFNLTDNKKGEKATKWKAKERYFNELVNPSDNPKESDLAKYYVEIQQRMTYPLLPIVFSIIALACILRGNFNRRGNTKNIVIAIVLAITFLTITIAIYDLVESSKKFTPILYLNFAIFIGLGLYDLTRNHFKKR